MEIGHRLKQIRNKSGHTQDSLAEATGLRRAHIQKLETNVHSPTINTLEVLLKACESTLAEFFKSEIPQCFPDGQKDLHEKLHDILSAGEPWTTGITVNIEAIHKDVQIRKRKEQKKLRPSKERKAG
ncbi:MAG: helix-turn-helix transcriptional regulator [Anaerolineales bacterium]|nr:helix-turn-helix transcriptional regulator [Anaerolineales bacterium]